MTSKATLSNDLPVFDNPVFRSTMASLIKGVPLVIQQGGTSSGKTYSVILALFTFLKQNTGLVCSIVSCSYPHLRRGAIRDFTNIAALLGGVQKHNHSDGVVTINGNVLEFFSADNDDKVRGGKRDILFINEANLINYERYRQLSIRTSRTVIIDYNPVSEYWLHTEVLPTVDAKDMVFKRTTYRDNPRIPEKIINEIERLKINNERLYRVYGLGLTGNIRGVIFPDIQLVNAFPFDCKKKAIGLDFGFTNDPTAVVRIGFLGDCIYIEELIHENGLTNPDIAERLKQSGVGRKEEIYADAAEPKSIEELKRLGWNIFAGQKKEIKYGIDIMQRYQLCVTKQSLNVIKEFRNYSWKVDASDRATNTPIDVFNHAMDAIRYAVIEKSSPPNLPRML